MPRPMPKPYGHVSCMGQLIALLISGILPIAGLAGGLYLSDMYQDRTYEDPSGWEFLISVAIIAAPVLIGIVLWRGALRALQQAFSDN